jgi:hypothetical protein
MPSANGRQLKMRVNTYQVLALCAAMLISAPTVAGAKPKKEGKTGEITIYRVTSPGGVVVLQAGSLAEVSQWALRYIQVWVGFKVEPITVNREDS